MWEFCVRDHSKSIGELYLVRGLEIFCSGVCRVNSPFLFFLQFVSKIYKQIMNWTLKKQQWSQYCDIIWQRAKGKLE